MEDTGIPRALCIYKAKCGWKQLPHHSVMQQSQIMGNDFCSLDRDPRTAPASLSFPQAVLEPQRRGKQHTRLISPAPLNVVSISELLLSIPSRLSWQYHLWPTATATLNYILMAN